MLEACSTLDTKLSIVPGHQGRLLATVENIIKSTEVIQTQTAVKERNQGRQNNKHYHIVLQRPTEMMSNVLLRHSLALVEAKRLLLPFQLGTPHHPPRPMHRLLHDLLDSNWRSLHTTFSLSFAKIDPTTPQVAVKQ
jgi:hypothetical protein